MSKISTTLVFFLVCMAMLISHGSALNHQRFEFEEDSTKMSRKWPFIPWWHHYPYSRPTWPWAHPPRWPLPPYRWGGRAHPPMPAHTFPPIPAPVAKCWKSVHEVEGYVHEIIESLFDGKLKASAGCCKAVMDVKDDCSPFVFRIPFFHLARKHCAGQAKSPPSKA
ncbi:unnamed protein product [Camellia sinensis]